MEVGWLGRYGWWWGSWVVGGMFAEVQRWEDRGLIEEKGKGTSFHVAGTQQIRTGHMVQHSPPQRQPLPHRLLKLRRSLMRWTLFQQMKMQDQRRWKLNHILTMSRLNRSLLTRLWLSHTGRQH